MNSLDMTLELFAARDPAPELVSDAQRKLETLIAARTSADTARSPGRAARGWLTAAATAAVVVVAMLWLPFGSAPALAFAKVQEHFRDFRTLRFDLEQRMNGELVMKTRVSMTRDGSSRTDVGDISVIVNAADQRVMTLMHSGRIAMEVPYGAPAKQGDGLEWLDEIRDFQGEAKALPNPRTIQGHEVHGWQLPTAAGDIVLWATAEGLPLEMTMGGSAGLKLDFHFEFDLPLDPKLFSTEIPAGYSLGKSED